jgi:hypothetical protein
MVNPRRRKITGRMGRLLLRISISAERGASEESWARTTVEEEAFLFLPEEGESLRSLLFR